MALRRVLSDALTLLLEQPRIFLPRLIMTVLWSLFWIELIHGIKNPAALTVPQAQILLGFILLMTPLQIWVYNSYFIIVRQYHDGHVSLIDAFRDGISRILEGLGAFLLGFTASLVLGLPGALLMAQGLVASNILLITVGVIEIGFALIATTILFYFVPASVVLGENGFLHNLREGLQTGQQYRREVTLLTLLTFGLLLLTTVLEGRLKTIGTIGFILGRALSAIISVYLLIVNPKMFLQTGEH
ncbi:MAG: hypothetical protein SVU32_07955 [Candidatus Nanohaloarchaea archaeon]|nr:hypothetical protein [Candidatus Nanohaloarchaea archaeon]